MGFSRSELRKILSAAGVADENIEDASNKLVKLHMDVVDPLKEQNDSISGKDKKIADLQKKLETANSELETLKSDDYKGKYESEKQAHDKLKADIQSKETTTKKSTAFKALLKEKGYSDKALAKITKYGGYVDGLELDNDGKIKDADKLLDSIKSDWDEYTPQETHVSHTPSVPDQQVSGKSDGDTAKAMKAFSDKYYYEHYGVKPDSANNSTAKEE